MDFELLSDEQILPSSNKTVKEVRKEINEKISHWEKYGSAFW